MTCFWRSINPPLAVVAALCVISMVSALGLAQKQAMAQTQTQTASAYRYTALPGWTRSVDDGVETLAPSAEAPGSVQVMLLPPKPLLGDFNAQFDSERSTLEAHWGLLAPQAAAPQRGNLPSGPNAGPYAAHFASYDSAGGPRYMSFLAVGRQGQFALMIFVASSDDAFNRLAPQATQMWQSLQLSGAR